MITCRQGLDRSIHIYNLFVLATWGQLKQVVNTTMTTFTCTNYSGLHSGLIPKKTKFLQFTWLIKINISLQFLFTCNRGSHVDASLSCVGQGTKP